MVENPQHTIQDWKHEVENGDTVLGYLEWVEHKTEEDEAENGNF